MNGIPDRHAIERRREKYKRGIKVRLEAMDDIQAPPTGTTGTVVGVDGIGQIMVEWSNGSHLSVIPEAGDSITII